MALLVLTRDADPSDYLVMYARHSEYIDFGVKYMTGVAGNCPKT
jgi:hypothetical protein